MTIALVQATSKSWYNPTSVNTLPWPAATTPGNLLVALVAVWDGSATPQVPLPTGWSVGRSDSYMWAGGQYLLGATFYLPNAASQTSYSQALTAYYQCLSIILAEFSGVATSSPLDATGLTVLTNVSSGSVSATQSGSNDLLLGALHEMLNNTAAASIAPTATGWTDSGQDTSSSATVGAALLYKQATGSGTQTFAPSWTQGTTNVLLTTLGFKAASGGGSSIALSATLPSGSALAASPTIKRPLVGMVPAASGLTGALTHKKPLAAPLPSAAQLAATLRISRPLAGGVASGVHLAGALTPSRPLAATLPTTAELTGTLTLQRPLVGMVGSGAGVAGTLTVQGATVSLSGSVPSGAGVSGHLTVKRRLSGSLSSTSSLAGTLTVGSPTIHLQGSIPSSSGCSGSLSISRPLQGSLFGQGRLAGTLSISLLHATIPSSAGCSGALTIGRKLAGGITSGAGCVGVLTIGQPTVHLTGGVPSGCGASGRLRIVRPLASTLLPGSGLGGSLKLTSNLTATILALTLSDRALASLLLSDDPLAHLVLADVEGA